MKTTIVHQSKRTWSVLRRDGQGVDILTSHLTAVLTPSGFRMAFEARSMPRVPTRQASEGARRPR